MALPWDSFVALDGDPAHNLELLCRALVQRNYGRYGQVRSRRNQPGIEFHLRLEADCDLGESGRWFGWQCRWYDLPKDHSLGDGRRSDILKAIESARSDVQGLTDFVLCLRELPRKHDVDWYFGLDVGLRKHLWADDEIETRLTGDAEVLRRTYFGELIVTADQLAETQTRTIAPVKQRWIPSLNVTTSVEDALRVALARKEGAEALREEIARLDEIAEALRAAHDDLEDDEVRTIAAAVAADILALARRLKGIAEACNSGRPDEARALVTDDARPAIAVRDVRRLARRLRAQRNPLALIASTVEPDLRYALRLILEHRRLMASPMIAVVGDAGRGKTQLAGQLTARSSSGHAGVFLRGSDLRAGGSLDELATRLPGVNAKTFDDLLEAVDAAGERIGARIPIVIDGLNDAQRPGEWKTQLAQIVPILSRYNHVLLIVTVRGALSDDALPEGTLELELNWDRNEVSTVVSRYFEHYRIDPGSSRLPSRLFAIPLFVRLYCEAVNPDRLVPVGVEALPSSLVAVFELYRNQAAKRLRVRPGHPTLPQGHIEKRLARLANELWQEGVRELPFERTMQLVDTGVDWDHSLVRALEEEGVLFRDSRSDWADDRSAVLFDAFAGYLIADALTRGLTVDAVDDQLSSAELWTKLRGSPDERHPLAADVLIALVGLIPRRFYGRQLWRYAQEDARDWALAQTADLESTLLDTETVDALAQLVQISTPPQSGHRHPFDRLWEVRDGAAHELNARFLDRVLREMPVADRDLRWTEWVRSRSDELMSDVDHAEACWEASGSRDDRDDLSARAIVWLLTTTVLRLRDTATRALQRYARPDPSRLFGLATELLDVNDAYVVERLLAACFGAATAHQMPDPGGAFESGLRVWLLQLGHRYLGPDATAPTSHQLARQYISGCFEFAERLHPAALPDDVDPKALTFVAAPEPDPIGTEDERKEECDETFGMNFENYIIGPLYADRGNYQMSHRRFVVGLATVRGRIWELGWRSARFAQLDKGIASDQWRRQESPERTERYGKKYGWIAYYELAGGLDDRAELHDRTWTSGRGVWPDIDPSFPEAPGALETQLPAWASTGLADDATWCRQGPIEVPDDLLTPEVVRGEPGPWVLVEAFLEHRDLRLSRRVWAFVRGVLTAHDDAVTLVAALESRQYLGNHYVPSAPSDHGSFAGEIPWSARFAAAGDLDNEKLPYRANVSERWDEPGIEVELLGHAYDIELSRTMTKIGSGYWVPSHNIASRHGLRQRSGTLDLVGLDGRTASFTLMAPPHFEGKLLYIRRELLAAYAAGRRLVQIAWGEREVDLDWANPPEWLIELRMDHADLWRRIRLVDL
jgi:hypothetical protein